MTYLTILNEIKTEARLKSDDDFNPMILALITEGFKEAVMSQRPFELKVLDSITLTAAPDTIALPDDFFLLHQLIFWDVDTEREWKLVSKDRAIQPAPRGMYGHPTSFNLIESNSVQLLPNAEIKSGDILKIEYFPNPPDLTPTGFNLNTENPVPRLEPFLIRFAARRLRLMHSEDHANVAQALTGDITSASSVYEKDEPTKPEPKGQ